VAGLTVAVTGPTGDIGLATLHALERSAAVERVIGIARRPFDPAAHGLRKVTYRRGDVLDREAVDAAFSGADVVIHLAFLIIGDPAKAQRINLEGSRNVFEAAVAAGVRKLIYTSSVAAYGFHEDNPQPLTEDVPARGSESFYYSAHKAELEKALAEVTADRDIDVFVFRPCIVAGATAPKLVETMVRMLPLYGQLPLLRRFIAEVPFLAPVVPDPGLRFQLVHNDDVAAALVAAVEGRGEPGTYNLAAEDATNAGAIARELGWFAVPLPKAVLAPLDEVLRRAPGLPVEVAWLSAFMTPVLMDCSKAREKLGWEPHLSSAATLAETVRGAREQGLV
jgi:UDP-glucose 4-epimerase